MPFTLTMPKLSPTMEEGTIVKWRIKENDHVKVGDTLFEVATDKATVEHNALDEGYLRKILVPEGGAAVVNQAVAIFTEKANESIEGYKPEGVEVAAKVEAEPARETEATAPPVREAAKVAGPGMQQPAFVPEPPLTNYEFQGQPSAIKGFVPASPLARKLAGEKGIDISTVKGSGPRGRVMSRDLDLGQPEAVVTFGRNEIPNLVPGTYTEEALTPIRKVVARRLQESKTFIPHFYVTQEINAEHLVSTREQLKAIGIKVSINDLIVRGVALALRVHPNVNSGFNSVNSTIIRFKTIDISIAVSLDDGLITPIVRHADYKDVGQISVEVRSLAARAREGKLAKEEYTGGSFTISNLGMFGISHFLAVINPPQAAILAVGGIEDRPIVKAGVVVPGKVMTLTLSVDHRVIDGADAAKFIKTVQQYLENSAMLLV
ncbi:MAG TPA: pyruvate dehydrogenase complex dihydrolipoamide acetyltransferase [Rhabdochlamydiaceae bacterium]|nr:pyruvate dehydrogenase complex dihydrolipoamide acetyltransferase [Rhabdochlamydiaceae bacterium]